MKYYQEQGQTVTKHEFLGRPVVRSQRINNLRDLLIDATPQICSDRAKLLTQAYQKYKSEPTVLKMCIRDRAHLARRGECDDKLAPVKHNVFEMSLVDNKTQDNVAGKIIRQDCVVRLRADEAWAAHIAATAFDVLAVQFPIRPLCFAFFFTHFWFSFRWFNIDLVL